MVQLKSGLSFKKFFGGKKMKAQKKNVFGAFFALFMLMASTIGQVALFAIPLAIVAPAVYALDGVGEVTYFDIDNTDADVFPGSDITKGVQTVNTNKTHVFKIHNNDTGAIDCIDEIIITYPKTWQHAIDLGKVSVTNMGSVDLQNLNASNEFNDNSVRIVPVLNPDGVMLCPSGTTQITISGNLSSPINPEDSTIKIYTSDQTPGGPDRALLSTLPVVHVTKAEELKIQYLD